MSKAKNDVGLNPLGSQVLIRVDAAATKTPGGLLIPDAAQGKATEGTVVAVGSGNRTKNGDLIPLDVVPGDRIMFGKWTGTELTLGGNRLLIMKETDILGVLS
jgi:chaperonin GroES